MYEDDAIADEKVYEDETLVCKECREAKKNAGKPAREYFTTVCADCGGEARVTFQPSDDRPVYCSACFEKRRKAAQQ